MKLICTFSVLSFFCFSACKVVKYSPDKLPANQLIIGDGGGFAGIETAYILLKNGQIFKKTGVDTYSEIKSIKPKEAEVMFDKANSLQLYKLDIDKPGNLYYFMRQVTKELDSKVVWGAGDYLPPEGLVALYKDISKQVKTREAAKAATTKTATGKKEKKSEPEDDKSKW